MTAVLLSVLIVAGCVALAVLVARGRDRSRREELQDRWGLTDDEVDRYEAELPQMTAALADSPVRSGGRRELMRLAQEATLKAILLKRVPRDHEDGQRDDA